VAECIGCSTEYRVASQRLSESCRMKCRTADGVANAAALESSRSARLVCGAARAYRWHVAVRGCALLATDSYP